MTHMEVFLYGLIGFLVAELFIGFNTGVVDVGETIHLALFYAVGVFNSYLYARKK